MFNRIGGLREDVPAGWTSRVADFLSTVDVGRLEVDFAKLEGLGVLPYADAVAYGVTGPIGRASGVDFDLRRDDPLPAYKSLSVTPVVRTEGDAAARVRCLLDEARLSVTLAAKCLEQLPSGAVNVRLPKAIKAPEGSVYTRVEAPLGTSGVHLSSRGEKTPWRLKLRTPSFNNVQALSALLPGTAVDDLPAVLSSFAVIVGDIDK
jgi:NADH-quinone oxidoreductase subunit D